VPPFRARMNSVPGQISRFLFTPTVAGRYEALCAQLCGVGHPNMRGFVVVEDAAAFQAWQSMLPTFAKTQVKAAPVPSGEGAAGGGARIEQGRALSESKGCVACHTIDGSPRVGPTWKGLFGKTETMEDGSRALVDEAYLRSFIADPTARRVKGFPPVMPKMDLSKEELDALVAYIQSLGSAPTAPAATEQKAQR